MIRLDNVTKKFDSFTAVNSVSLTVETGCIYGLVGSNGAGKSTLLRLICGVYKADDGLITVDGKPVYENPEMKSDIVFVPDELYFLPQASIRTMAKMYDACYKNFDISRLKELCNLFNLDIKKNLNTFSKGMKRQAATVLALAARPKILLLDETFDGLDPVMRNLLKNILYDCVLKDRITVILTSHSLRELEDTCDHLAVLHQGKVVEESEVTSLKTEMFKVQVALQGSFDKSCFENIEMTEYSQTGSVASFIVSGDKEQVSSEISKLNPILFEILPLSLEEVFVHDMNSLGYKFKSTEE